MGIEAYTADEGIPWGVCAALSSLVHGKQSFTLSVLFFFFQELKKIHLFERGKTCQN